MAPEKALKGTHGTCLEYARRIERDGFRISTGRVGAGVYFWAYDLVDFESFAKRLALSWCFAEKKKGKFSRIKDDACVAVFAEIIPGDGFLDFEDPLCRERLTIYCDRLAKRGGLPDTAAIYELFVRLLEREYGKSIDVIHVRVAPPDRRYYKPMIPIEVTGYPRCYVVRNKHCISVIKIESEESDDGERGA